MPTLKITTKQALDTNPRAIPQINFTVNLDRVQNTRTHFIPEEAK